jgi:hypothetical protein
MNEEQNVEQPKRSRGGRPKGVDQMASVHHTRFKAKFPRGPQFKVEVSREIMEHARVRDSSHCMVAMAVRDVMPQAASIAVDIQTIRFSLRDKGLRYTYLTPRQAQVAIIQFDQGIMPEPFSFRLTGAHVTRIARHPKVQTPRATQETEARKAALRKANQVRLGKLKLTLGSGQNGPGSVRRVGGLPPPLSNFARRRQFGLKALHI